MHELSIAIAIVEIASEELQRIGGGRVETVRLKVGPLSGVEPEALMLAYELAREGTPLEGSKLQINHVAVEIECPTCGGPQRAVSVRQMVCSKCGTPSSKMVHGRELDVIAMEISDEQPAKVS